MPPGISRCMILVEVAELVVHVYWPGHILAYVERNRARLVLIVFFNVALVCI